MRNAWIFGRRLVQWLALFAFGHGIILYLSTIEIFPDRIVASMITMVTGTPIWAHWLMAGAFGLLGTLILERFLWNGYLSPAPTASQNDAGPAAVPDTGRYMTAYEVIHYLVDDSKWGNEVRHGPSAQSGMVILTKPLLEAQVEFKRVEEQGAIHSVGRLNGVGQYIPIPETYWMSATLNPFSFANPEISETMPDVFNPDGIPTYKRVRILKADVERIWPRRGMVMRLYDKLTGKHKK